MEKALGLEAFFGESPSLPESGRKPRLEMLLYVQYKYIIINLYITIFN